MKNTEYKVYPKKELENEEILKANEENNKLILERLENFRKINNLEKTDFVVVGSTAASYMQYLAITNPSDVDVVLFDYDAHPDLQKTEKMDLLHFPFLLNDYKDRIQEKDGYLFVSDTDFLVQVLFAVLYRIITKESHLTYSRLMIKELGFTKEEFEKFVTDSIEKLDDGYESMKERIIKNYNNRVDEFYADLFEENVE